MPEWSEVKISSDYINSMADGKTFTALYDVEKGNNAILNEQFSNFTITSNSNGKELIVYLTQNNETIPIYVFMGMSGNWAYVPTSEWINTKFTRMRLDDSTGNSLLLFGGFLGPKYSINSPFSGTKRSPDPVNQHEAFKKNILSNLDKKDFDKPIFELLLEQKYFNGIGNYLRSTILYYLDENPFISARDMINKRPDILELCRDIPLQAYKYNGGQLKDWKNPFNVTSNIDNFDNWVFYKKGKSIKDSKNRTFWYNEKWKLL